MPSALRFVVEVGRVTDWLESGVVALSGFVPPGRAASQAREWSAELEQLCAQRGRRVRIDGARLLAERVALTGDRPQGTISAGGACRLLACVDGWVALSLPRPSDLELVAPLIGADSPDPWRGVSDWVRHRPAAEVMARTRLLGLAAGRLGEPVSPLQLPNPAPAHPAPAGPAPKAPLVVDFSSLWAGPLCANLLGLAGARVVKVESVERLDGVRRGEPRFYDLLHAGHESVCVDPRLPSDRAALSGLVAAADVVIESSRPRALAGWGLRATDAVNAGAVWVSITAWGRAAGDRVGFGDDVAAAAGMVGWGPGAPAFVGDAIADPLTGLAAAVGALRALAAGGGRLLDVGMAPVVAATLDGTATRPIAGGPALPYARSAAAPARPAGSDSDLVLAPFRQ